MMNTIAYIRFHFVTVELAVQFGPNGQTVEPSNSDSVAIPRRYAQKPPKALGRLGQTLITTGGRQFLGVGEPAS
jgi:hypothetical protein